MSDFALTFFYGFDMYRVLGSLRTQYWFWFVRDGLIKLELDGNLDSKRQAILLNLIENPTLMYVYSNLLLIWVDLGQHGFLWTILPQYNQTAVYT